MEININELEELEQNYDYDYDYDYNDFYPEIPSTNNLGLKTETVLEEPKINVVKKAVRFDENINPMLKQNKRPIVNQKQKPQISYEDILSKMGMFVTNGKLHLVDNTQKQEQVPIQQRQRQIPKQQTQNNYVPEQITPQNSYIYNKYFKDELTNSLPRRPQTASEYKQMLINQIIQQKISKIRQTNYKKLVIHNSNINVADGRGGQLNKLFRF
jgi:hypothetical protein